MSHSRKCYSCLSRRVFRIKDDSQPHRLDFDLLCALKNCVPCPALNPKTRISWFWSWSWSNPWAPKIWLSNSWHVMWHHAKKSKPLKIPESGAQIIFSPTRYRCLNFRAPSARFEGFRMRKTTDVLRVIQISAGARTCRQQRKFPAGPGRASQSACPKSVFLRILEFVLSVSAKLFILDAIFWLTKLPVVTSFLQSSPLRGQQI